MCALLRLRVRAAPARCGDGNTCQCGVKFKQDLLDKLVGRGWYGGGKTQVWQGKDKQKNELMPFVLNWLKVNIGNDWAVDAQRNRGAIVPADLRRSTAATSRGL